MSLDFQQVRQHVKEFGEDAVQRQQQLSAKRDQASKLLESYACKLDELRQKVQQVVRDFDPTLRCALPVHEALNGRFPLPPLPQQATILAADGSQIFIDRHAEVQYGLINVGAIQMRHGAPAHPTTLVSSKLFYGENIYSLTDDTMALRRDLTERKHLVKLASQAAAPVITFTDGPMELWGAKAEGGEEASEFKKSLQAYLVVLAELHTAQATTAGYVDKPGADLVIRLLEIARAALDDMPEIRKYRPLRAVTDRGLYRDLLDPGERSAVFALQSQSAHNYYGPLALHFFYLNVGQHRGRPYLARVEIPAWVAESPQMLDNLHAILIYQCRMMGSRPYPYLLHRAHETAVVTHQEQEQVTQMIVQELNRRGIPIEGLSHKQGHKEGVKRTRYKQ